MTMLLRLCKATSHTHYLSLSLTLDMVQDSVLVIRNGFLETLPDTLLQHGHKLLRISDARQLNEFDYAFYKVIE